MKPFKQTLVPFSIFVISLTYILQSLLDRHKPVTPLFSYALLGALVLWIIVYTGNIIFFEKMAKETKLVRPLSPEEMKETGLELKKYTSIGSHIILSISGFAISLILIWILTNVQIFPNAELQDYTMWVPLIIIAFSGIVFVGSLHNLVKKRALERDLRDGVFSIEGLAHAFGILKSGVTETGYSMRIGKFSLYTDSNDISEQLSNSLQKRGYHLHVQFLAGTHKIIDVKPAFLQ